MNHSPVLHYRPEFAQTYVHWVNDAIQLYLICQIFLLLKYGNIKSENWKYKSYF